MMGEKGQSRAENNSEKQMELYLSYKFTKEKDKFDGGELWQRVMLQLTNADDEIWKRKNMCFYILLKMMKKSL